MIISIEGIGFTRNFDCSSRVSHSLPSMLFLFKNQYYESKIHERQ
jgi:hypothetical protein